MHRKALALAGAAVVALAAPAVAQTTTRPAAAAAAAPTAARPAPVAALVRAIDIPYQQFTLPNGLRVVVHTDRKAPVVAVSVWYNVGSKFEPAGKTGFAHLFEHLMFNGSENAPGDFFEPLKQVGATDYNGTTYFDRTNYFETVPTPALDRALFLESDRMGYLTGAITQAVLDEQRGVVQNEKRQGDNQPYGLTQYKQVEGLFPAGHPYAHTTIGSMTDLDAASLQTVKDWFHDHYGPNNAVLVLAGDVDLATARRLVTKYFGSIPRGPASVAPPAPIPTLKAAVNETIKDRVAQPLIQLNWAVPGVNDKASTLLDVAAGVLGGGPSSRLYDALVRQSKLAVQVDVSNQTFAQLGFFEVDVLVAPGADVAAARARTQAVIADFIKNGPTADEVQRFVTRTVAQRIDRLESVGGFGGKAVALAEGALYSNDPGHYRTELNTLAAATPASVRQAAATWLARPVYALTVVQGPRDAYAEAEAPKPVAVATAPDTKVMNTRGGLTLPAVGQIGALAFPPVQRARLSNGIELVYAQRSAVPVTQAVMSFDAGAAADVPTRLGTQALTLNMLDEGTDQRSSIQIAQDKDRLGAQIGSGSSADRTTVSLEVPSANLAGGLDLWADIIRHPAFRDADLQRARAQQVAGIEQELTDPGSLATRVARRLAYGPAYPYARQQGSGDPAAVATLGTADLRRFQQAWLRPDKAKIFVTSDRPLVEVQAALEAEFGDWQGSGPAGAKDFATPPQPSTPKIVLVDRPDSPQSVIAAVIPTALVGTDDLLPVVTANDALGGSFLSRINMDLRETRHWSYGASGSLSRAAYATPYLTFAPVQANQTGPSLASMRDDIVSFVTTKPLTQPEFDRAITGAVRQLSGQFETSEAVLAAMQANDLYKRPDDYYATITQRYRGFTRPQLATAIGQAIDPKRAVWVVVGDAKAVRPQLDSIGLPVEVIPAAAVAGAPLPAAPATTK